MLSSGSWTICTSPPSTLVWAAPWEACRASWLRPFTHTEWEGGCDKEGVVLEGSEMYVWMCRVVSVSACVQTHPSSIALRYVQRRILMSDPNWNNGRYYDRDFPYIGMQHAR